jgi:hypothetical protein
MSVPRYAAPVGGFRQGLGLCVACGALAACVTPAHAATIEVDTPFDQFGTVPEECALREAVEALNTDADFGGCQRIGAGDDTIHLDAGGTYDLEIAGVEDLNAAGDLDIEGDLIIVVEGDAGKATIDGNDLDRVIEIRPDASLAAAKLVVTDGSVGADPEQGGGGGIANFGRLELRSSKLISNEAPLAGNRGNGGALDTWEHAVLTKVSIVDNHAANVGGGISLITGGLTVVKSTVDQNGAGNVGGGIYVGDVAVEEPASISQSTVSRNTADGEGGGIHVGIFSGGRLNITNSTISGNAADQAGGGIDQFAGETVIRSATITANTADADVDGEGHGGGLSGAFDIKNTIIAANFDLNPVEPAHDCESGTGGFGRNLVGTAGGCDAFGSTIQAADPKLKPLADNGGPTETHALKRRSPAIGEAGMSAPPKDQRGVKRDAHPDIGAYERR